jgi:hypothetical protein
VEKKALEQWYFRISECAQSLLDGLETEPLKSGWPAHVRRMQRNWIGKRQGHLLDFGGTNQAFTFKLSKVLKAENSKVSLYCIYHSFTSMEALEFLSSDCHLMSCYFGDLSLGLSDRLFIDEYLFSLLRIRLKSGLVHLQFVSFPFKIVPDKRTSCNNQ